MSTLQGDYYIRGNLSVAGQLNLPTGSIEDADVAVGAAIQATKIIQQRRPEYSQSVGSAAVADNHAIYLVYGATGVLNDFRAGMIVANVGAAVVTVDLRVNGTSVLTSPITLNSSQSAYQSVVGSISDTALEVGDVLTVVITATAGGGTLGQGLFAAATFTETPV